jgi:hypothetical protein
MKVDRHLARIEPMILNPVHGLPADEWHRAPPGKWTIAQIVQHLAISIDVVAKLFAERAEKKGMRRRAKPHETVMRHLVLGAGRIPGLPRVSDLARPEDEPDRDLTTAQFRMGIEEFSRFSENWPEERREAVFVRHPLLGDLNLAEWVRFHYLHCRHHAREIRDRVRWLEATRD